MGGTEVGGLKEGNDLREMFGDVATGQRIRCGVDESDVDWLGRKEDIVGVDGCGGAERGDGEVILRG
jgi:hypothetical protein